LAVYLFIFTASWKHTKCFEGTQFDRELFNSIKIEVDGVSVVIDSDFENEENKLYP
jgi:hypothetical protein